MAVRRTAILAFILASTTLVPAASAWQEKMRTLTQARILMTGALAIATLPAGFVLQAQNTTTSGSSPSADAAEDAAEITNFGPSCSSRQGCVVQLFYMTAFMFCIVSLPASYVILTLPDEVGQTSLVDHRDYMRLLDIAGVTLYAAMFMALIANTIAAAMNPFGRSWEFAIFLCGTVAMFAFVTITWSCTAYPMHNPMYYLRQGPHKSTPGC